MVWLVCWQVASVWFRDSEGVLLRDEADEDFRLLDAISHPAVNIACHLLLIKPAVDIESLQFSVDCGDARMVVPAKFIDTPCAS